MRFGGRVESGRGARRGERVSQGEVLGIDESRGFFFLSRSSN